MPSPERKIECALYMSLQRESVRMEPSCENPLVKSGTQKCSHFIARPDKNEIDAPDITEFCRRAVSCRIAPRVDRQ